MKRTIFSLAIATSLLLSGASFEAGAQLPGKKDFKAAVALYQQGLYDQARIAFESIAEKGNNLMAEGYAVLCEEKMKTPGYETSFERYTDRYPYSILTPQVKLQYALNLFEEGDYKRAAYYFGTIDDTQVAKKDVPEYLFKYAYSCFETGKKDNATRLFTQVDELNSSDYSGPSRYALGYQYYEDRRFEEAIKWFEKARKDQRFAAMSSYYLIDSKYMIKEYGYVVSEGPSKLETVPADCRPHLARIISESYLVLGDADAARKFYSNSGAPETRSDYYFAGSLMYAVKDWHGAIENYTAMEDRTDSLGQKANYYLGYSYIQLKNKIAAMRSFKDASNADFDHEVTEDAFFNYAKLAFDLNNDASAFNSYIQKYPSKANNDRIYGYMAVAALRSRDYEAAVEAFDKIDDLDPNMRGNYMKTNYLRANQLVNDGAFKGAIPCLKAAAYYADRKSYFYQLSRFWLAESYFRSGDYANARTVYTELYNQSALDGMDEGPLIPFSLGYCYFKDGDYDQAIKWFDSYLDEGDGTYRKGAFLRKADCWFMKKKYSIAIPIYEKVSVDYQNVNDIYPYYQAGVCYGLTGSNAKKISALLPVKKASPDSRFYSEAMYELGRAYVASNKSTEARICFEDLLENAKDSTYMAKSLIELGMIFRNAKKYDAALDYYKQVVEKMPDTGYSDDALAAIESIYQTKADPQSYLDYLAEIGRSGMKTEAEKEAMIFNAAEQIYLSEDYEKALASLEVYLKQYPAATMTDKAYYYMADSYRKLGQKETACDTYAKVISMGSGAYQEIALVQYSELAQSLHRYEDAYKGYSRLLDVAQFDDNKYLALKGRMMSAYKGRMFDIALESAEAFKKDKRSDEDAVRLADWVTAKSYLATSRRDEALDVLVRLAVKPRTAEGAEAVYLMIQDCYDRADFDRVEELVYSFSDSGSNQEYWIAKSFIVLGDSFLERGDGHQAMATYESIVNGYTPQGEDDDIIDNVNLRINRLKE